MAKRVPQRMCVVCRKMRNKRDLLRLVRRDGEIRLDAIGKMPGRGFYVCKDPACIEALWKGRRLEQQLELKALEPACKDQLKEQVMAEALRWQQEQAAELQRQQRLAKGETTVLLPDGRAVRRVIKDGNHKSL
ncbi:YlxR family protein [Oscillospiraceae bacterium HV4-5-C5C]|nr:YlxR family protein [Oscillospiraceae bacterium HV4-5-C5C]